jgi:hypothetical protein
MVLKMSMSNTSNFDRGSEFIGQDFQKAMKEDYGVKAKPITARNPQRQIP